MVLHKFPYSAPVGNNNIAGNIEAVCGFKCLDLHNSRHDKLIAAVDKCATADQGMPLKAGCAEIHSRDVDGLFIIGLSWNFGGLHVCGKAVGGFKANFCFEPDCNAHTKGYLLAQKRVHIRILQVR